MRVDSYETWVRRQRIVYGALEVGLVLALCALYPVRVAGDLRERLRGLVRQVRRRLERPRGW